MTLVALRDPSAAGRVITLHPGGVGLGQRGDRFETLLGSCVAVVLTDPRRTVGAMCHIVHPGPARHGATPSAFADVALHEMTRLLAGCGLTPRLCEAYVVGGGNMFPQQGEPRTVGDVNVDWAMAHLDALGIHVIDVDVRGAVYRRLRWTVGPEAPQVDAVAL